MLISVCYQIIKVGSQKRDHHQAALSTRLRHLVATVQVPLQGVAELQQQVAELKLERSQLLKAVTESQHDAACLAEHVRQIGQLKQVLAAVQQENSELTKDHKVQCALCLS